MSAIPDLRIPVGLEATQKPGGSPPYVFSHKRASQKHVTEVEVDEETVGWNRVPFKAKAKRTWRGF
jgi:hypothetical protein